MEYSRITIFKKTSSSLFPVTSSAHPVAALKGRIWHGFKIQLGVDRWGDTTHNTHEVRRRKKKQQRKRRSQISPSSSFVREGEFAQPTDETMQILAENPLRGASKTQGRRKTNAKKIYDVGLMVKDPAGSLLKAGHGGRVEGSGDNSRPRNASLLPSSLSRHYFHRIHDVKIGRGSGGFVCVNVNSFGRLPTTISWGYFFYRIQPIQILPVVQQFNGFNERA